MFYDRFWIVGLIFLLQVRVLVRLENTCTSTTDNILSAHINKQRADIHFAFVILLYFIKTFKSQKRKIVTKGLN